MNLSFFLNELKSYFTDLLIFGIKNLSFSVIKDLKDYSEIAGKLNLSVLSDLLNDFIDRESERVNIYLDISFWLDLALLIYEEFLITEEFSE